MQVEEERKQAEQYKDQVGSLNAPMLKHKSGHLACILTVNRGMVGQLKRVPSLRNSSVHLPGGKVEYPREAAEAAARGVGGGVSARDSRPQEAAARAG